MFLDKLSLPCDLDQYTWLQADDHVPTPHLSTPDKKENRINISACTAYLQKLIIPLLTVYFKLKLAIMLQAVLRIRIDLIRVQI